MRDWNDHQRIASANDISGLEPTYEGLEHTYRLLRSRGIPVWSLPMRDWNPVASDRERRVGPFGAYL